MGFSLFLLYLLLVFMRPVDWLVPWLEPLRPLALVSALAFVTALTQAIRQGNAAAMARHYWLLAGLLLAIAVSMIATGWMGGVPQALAEFSTSALLFLLTAFNLRTVDHLRRACGVIAFSMLTLACLGIYSFHTGYMSEYLVLQQYNNPDNEMDIPAERPEVPAEDTSGAYMWRVRAFGFFNDPNDFGQSMVMAVPFLFFGFRPGKRFRNLVMVGLPAAVLIYAIYLTNSRGALLGLASLLFFQVKERLGTVKTGAMVVLAAIGALAANFTGGRGFSTEEESASGRISAWYDGFQMLKNHPLFGVGYGNFLDHHHLTAHNSFVLCFAELGLFGYFFWMALVVLAFQAVFLVVKHAPVGSPERHAAVILRSSLVGFFVCTFFLSRTYMPVLYVLLAASIAVWIGPLKMGRYAGIPALEWSRHGWVMPTLIGMFGSMAAIYVLVAMR